MRWKGILFLLVVFGIVIVLSLIFTDLWLEARLEGIGTSIVGAKVEFENVDFSIFGLHMKWDSLQVTNPKNTMKNIFTSGHTEFDMQLAPLLRKKVVIENIQMTNVTSGTDRTMDGKVEKKPRPQQDRRPNFIIKTINRLEQDVSAAPAWNLEEMQDQVNVDSILNILNIRSPEKIDSLQNQIKMTYDHWDSTFNAVQWEEDFNFLGSRIRAVKPDEIQTLEGLQTAYTTLDKVYNKVDSLETFVMTAQDSLTEDLQTTQNKIGLVDDWIQQDYQNALDKAKLPAINKENMAIFLFGNRVVNQASQVLGTINTVRSYTDRLQSDKPKKEKPPRLRGQTIYFVQQQQYPSFWIKNVNLSGHTTRGLRLEGTLQHVVSQQKIIGEPTTLNIQGQRGDGANIALNAELNYLGESPRELFSFNASQVPLQNVKLSNSELIPNRVEQGLGQLQTNLTVGGESLDGSLEFEAQSLVFDFGEQPSEKQLDRTVRQILQQAQTLDVQAALQSSEERTQFGLNSNLDDLFARELRNMVGEEIQNARARIEERVQEEIAPYEAQFKTFVDEKTSQLQAEMQKYEDLLNEQKSLIETKQQELEVRIEEEKAELEGELEDEVKKRLRGILD